MARAQSLSLPGGLDELCSTLNFPGKDPRGRKLVLKTCKPFKGIFHENIDEYRELLAYNVQDVWCLMNVHKMLPELNAEERVIFERSWRKNDIGLPVDIELAAAIAMRREAIEVSCATQLRELTDNIVTSITQRARILQWANQFPRTACLPGTKKHEVAEALENPDLHPDVRMMLEVIQENGGSALKSASVIGPACWRLLQRRHQIPWCAFRSWNKRRCEPFQYCPAFWQV
jgi:hypothetical protein